MRRKAVKRRAMAVMEPPKAPKKKTVPAPASTPSKAPDRRSSETSKERLKSSQQAYVDLTARDRNQLDDAQRHVTKLLEKVRELKPKVVLEIGTAKGGTLFLFAQVAEPDAIIVSIDLPRGRFGGGYPKWMIPIFKSFFKENQKLYLIRRDSHDPLTLNIVKSILANRSVDFLFIDGDHTYEGVRKDFEMYSPLVRRGGIIAFHDIVPHDRVHDPHGVVGVPRFWNEIKHSYKSLEIVKDWGQGWAGIGVLYV